MTIPLTPALLYALIGHAVALAFYGGMTWAMLRRQGQTLDHVVSLLENHGERIAGVEARQGLPHRRPPIIT